MPDILVPDFSAEDKARIKAAALATPIRLQSVFCRMAIMEKVADIEASLHKVEPTQSQPKKKGVSSRR